MSGAQSADRVSVRLKDVQTALSVRAGDVQGLVLAILSTLRQMIRLLRIRQNAAFMVLMQRQIDELRQRYSGDKRLEPAGYKVYSQGDEDGIIAEIFKRIGTTDRRFVEFGCGDGVENNTAYLLLQGWSGLWIDSLEHNELVLKRRWKKELDGGKLVFRRAMVTSDNIDALIKDGGISGPVDLLVIDIDSNDYHVWKAISAIEPRVVCIEYNAKFPPPVEWIMPRDDNYVWQKTDWMGASLSAMAKLGAEKGYALVGCDIIGSNAFFVRQELAQGHFAEPFTAENHYQPPRYYLGYGFYSGHPTKT